MIAAGLTGSRTGLESTKPINANKLKIITSFYPLYDFASHVGGDRIDVSTMIPSGVEPHDWEPTPKDVKYAKSVDVFIYNGLGFDQWAERIDTKFMIDTSQGLEGLVGDAVAIEENSIRKEEVHSHKSIDPHIWLDPILAKHQVERIRYGLTNADPNNADYYNQNTENFIAELDSLDTYIKKELAGCNKSDFIAFHNAFGQFAKRYGLNQYSLLGPELEEEAVSLKNLQQIINFARKSNINTIYSEELLDPRLAKVVSAEIPNGKVLVLSPIENIEKNEQDTGIRYIDKIKKNILNLKEGLDCKQ